VSAFAREEMGARKGADARAKNLGGGKGEGARPNTTSAAEERTKQEAPSGYIKAWWRGTWDGAANRQQEQITETGNPFAVSF